MKHNSRPVLSLLQLLICLLLSSTVSTIFLDDFDDNDDCAYVQCPTDSKCPADSQLKSEEYGMFADSQVEALGAIQMDNSSQNIDNVRECCSSYICSCRKCQWPKCMHNEVVVKVRYGSGKPGSCCDTFKCIKKFECDAEIPNKYDIEYWENPCIKCKCEGDDVLCNDMCEQQHDVDAECDSKTEDDIWFEDESCSKCSCVDGKKSCESTLCNPYDCPNPIKVEGKCCKVCSNEEEFPFFEVPINTTKQTNTEEDNTRTVAMINTTVRAISAGENEILTTNATTKIVADENLLNNSTKSTDSILVTSTINTTMETVTSGIVSSAEATNASSTEDANGTSTKSTNGISSEFTDTSSTQATSSTEATSDSFTEIVDTSSTEVTNGSSTEVTNGSSTEVTNGTSTKVTTGSLTEVTNGSSTEVTNGSSTEVTKGSSNEVTTDSLIEVTNGSSSEVTKGSSTEDINGSSTVTGPIYTLSSTTENISSSIVEERETTATSDTEPSSSTENTQSNLIGQSTKTTAETTSPPDTSTSEAFTAYLTTSSPWFDLNTSTQKSPTSSPSSTTTVSTTETPLSSSNSTSAPKSTLSITSTFSPYDNSSSTSSHLLTSSVEVTDFSSTTIFVTSAPPASKHAAPTRQQRQYAPNFMPNDNFSSSSTTDGSNVSDENSAEPNLFNTQQQTCCSFDELDPVVIFWLMLFSITCVILVLALVLIIHCHAKNKRKIYSTVPSSETNLSHMSHTSHNSTSTVLEV